MFQGTSTFSVEARMITFPASDIYRSEIELQIEQHVWLAVQGLCPWNSCESEEWGLA